MFFIWIFEIIKNAPYPPKVAIQQSFLKDEDIKCYPNLHVATHKK